MQVARLRAGQHPVAQSPDVRKATASFKETDEKGNCPGECRRGRVWEDGTTSGQAVEDLRNQVAQLKVIHEKEKHLLPALLEATVTCSVATITHYTRCIQ